DADALLGDDDRSGEEDDAEPAHDRQLRRQGLAPRDAPLSADDDQRPDRAADDPAEMAADADVGGGEGEDQVDHEPERELLDDLHLTALAGDDDRRDEQAVD